MASIDSDPSVADYALQVKYSTSVEDLMEPKPSMIELPVKILYTRNYLLSLRYSPEALVKPPSLPDLDFVSDFVSH